MTLEQEARPRICTGSKEYHRPLWDQQPRADGLPSVVELSTCEFCGCQITRIGGDIWLVVTDEQAKAIREARQK